MATTIISSIKVNPLCARIVASQAAYGHAMHGASAMPAVRTGEAGSGGKKNDAFGRKRAIPVGRCRGASLPQAKKKEPKLLFLLHQDQAGITAWLSADAPFPTGFWSR
ncbi:hypothetical protein [Janthinobacterium sp. RT4P48]|uniref:hypothetical protein n=1 Tax=Janthinobacterium sp. RT4P48 TaxID=3424188 RepID=UPI003F26696E